MRRTSLMTSVELSGNSIPSLVTWMSQGQRHSQSLRGRLVEAVTRLPSLWDAVRVCQALVEFWSTHAFHIGWHLVTSFDLYFTCWFISLMGNRFTLGRIDFIWQLFNLHKVATNFFSEIIAADRQMLHRRRQTHPEGEEKTPSPTQCRLMQSLRPPLLRTVKGIACCLLSTTEFTIPLRTKIFLWFFWSNPHLRIIHWRSDAVPCCTLCSVSDDSALMT